jgi:hypothetical protein
MVAVVTELRKLGATVEEGRDYCIITPPKQASAVHSKTYTRQVGNKQYQTHHEPQLSTDNLHVHLPTQCYCHGSSPTSSYVRVPVRSIVMERFQAYSPLDASLLI